MLINEEVIMRTELNEVLQYIEEHIHTNIKLEDIASKYHYSQSHISRHFNRYVGMGLNEYINRRKLSLIAEDIRTKDKTISYLADIYGYNSQKYFSTKFKELFHITPSHYRKGQTFIVLQPIRTIQGGNQIMLNTINELCFELWKQSEDENTLLDAINAMNNVILHQKSNSEITMIVYVVEEKYTNIYEVELNLINGLHKKKTLFYSENKLHKLVELGEDDESKYVIFEDHKTKKQLRANFHQGNQPHVIFQTNTIEGYKMPEDNDWEFDINQVYKEIDELKETILQTTNEKEIKHLCDKTENLILMRHFGSEFVFVKMVQQGHFFMLVSIYVNMETKFAESYHFLGSGSKSTNITCKKEGMMFQVYTDDKLFSNSYILGGEEVVSSIFLQFPSGMSGSGGWDFSPEFK